MDEPPRLQWHAALFHLLAQISAPLEQLRRTERMASRHRRNRLSAGIALGDNRRPYFVRPISPTTGPGKNLEAMDTAGASIIT
jgi:hypothetical protein